MNTHGQKTEVFCENTPWSRVVSFWLRMKTWSPDQATYAMAQPLTWRTMTEAEEGTTQPCAFSLQHEQAQQFMDELWRVGFRPTEGSGSAGSLAATERHLADMRALVFKQTPKA